MLDSNPCTQFGDHLIDRLGDRPTSVILVRLPGCQPRKLSQDIQAVSIIPGRAEGEFVSNKLLGRKQCGGQTRLIPPNECYQRLLGRGRKDVEEAQLDVLAGDTSLDWSWRMPIDPSCMHHICDPELSSVQTQYRSPRWPSNFREGGYHRLYRLRGVLHYKMP